MADTLTPAQQAFIKSITDQVNQLLSTQLPGTFEVVSYPAGFHYGIQNSNPPGTTNASTLNAFNSTLTRGTNGLLTLGNDVFSSMYFKIISGAFYKYSPTDLAVVQDPNIQSQQIAVTQEATSSGYVAQFSISPVTYLAVIKSILANFGKPGRQEISPADIAAAAGSLNNAGFANLGQAISNAVNQLAPLNAILNTQSQAEQARAAAQNNSQHPNAANGGVQTGLATYQAGWSNLPTNNQVLGNLQSDSKVSISINASNFSSTSTHLKIGGSTGFTVPIFDFIEVGIKGGASYDMSKYTQSSSSLDITSEYPGVSIIQADPTPLAADYTTGWYDQSLLQSIIAGSNDPHLSGFKIDSNSQWNVPDTFGEGRKFSRLKTFVISQYPTIKMAFAAGNSSAITTDFKENSSVSVKLFGLFSIGSVDQSYEVKKVDTTSVAGKIIVTLAPPDIKGTVPLEAQVCYILGGVADYPPPTV